MAYTYSHLYGIQTVGLRFFTVYGPWGRPDMAYFKFTKAILEGKPIEVYNHGNLKRDFTYIDDIIKGILKIVQGRGGKEYDIYNIGNSDTVNLIDFIQILENILKKEANKKFVEMQPGDVRETYAGVKKISKKYAFSPNTVIKEGLKKFVEWYINYNNIVL